MEERASSARGLDSLSVWTGKAHARISVQGPNSVESEFEGSFGFTVYLAGHTESIDLQGQKVPANSVFGKLAGGFKAQASAQDQELSGSGGVHYLLNGRFDPSKESITFDIRISGMDATGKQTLLEGPGGGRKGVPAPLTVNWNTGRRSAMDDAYEDLPSEPFIVEAPKLPNLRQHHPGDHLLLSSAPQGGRAITLNLRNPSPQVATQTVEDEAFGGTRITTWTFALVPLFEIERDDSKREVAHSFISSDKVSFHISIPGVSVPSSQWERLISWRVSGQGPLAGNGVPSEGSQMARFAFTPNPSNRPTGGSAHRNRPISYHIEASLEGTVQHYFLVQDEIDMLRQEYVDHGLTPVPSRSELVAHPIDGTLNQGNYSFVVDGGMNEALERIDAELSRSGGGGTVRVLRGFLSPQRNRFASGSRGDGRSFGRSLDLAPGSADGEAWERLREICSVLGYTAVCEDEHNVALPCDSPRTDHVHVTWPHKL